MMTPVDKTLRHLTGYRLRRTTSAAMPGVNKVLAEFGLRRSTYSSLVVIVENPGLNQGQLADALAIERPNVVQVIDDLERAALVRRTKSVEDRRAYALQPTAEGEALEERATAALTRFDRDLTAGLSQADIQHLHHCLQRIEENAEDVEVQNVCDVPAP